jgi:uncharacterized protein
MRTRHFDPLHLDVEAFARSEAVLEGRWPLSQLERLCASAAPDEPVHPDDVLAWEIEGELRSARGKDPEIWLRLRAQAEVSMTCQRCLKPVRVPLNVAQSIRFVAGEKAAEALDFECEEDVLALTRSLNTQALLEDELLLTLPLVPRHERCPEPLIVGESAPLEEDCPNPFAALAGLKAGQNDGG